MNRVSCRDNTCEERIWLIEERHVRSTYFYQSCNWIFRLTAGRVRWELHFGGEKICSHSVFLKGWQTLGYDTNNKKRRIRVFWVPSLLLCMQRWKCHCCFFKSAGPLKRRGIAYISRSSFFNVISCQKSAREYGTRSRLFDSFSLTLFCLLPRVFCATLLNCIQAWNHLERLSFLESVLFFLFVCLFLFTQKCHPKNWG